MFTVLCSCSLSHNDNGNPVVYNIKYSDRNIHQKIEKNFEIMKMLLTRQNRKVRNILLKYVCIIAINMLTAAVQMGLVQNSKRQNCRLVSSVGRVPVC